MVSDAQELLDVVSLTCWLEMEVGPVFVMITGPFKLVKSKGNIQLGL